MNNNSNNLENFICEHTQYSNGTAHVRHVSPWVVWQGDVIICRKKPSSESVFKTRSYLHLKHAQCYSKFAFVLSVLSFRLKSNLFQTWNTVTHALHTQDFQWRYTCGFIEMYTSLSVFLCKSNVGYFFDWLTASSYGTITVGSIITHAFGHTITYWLIASLYSCFAQVWN